MVKPNRQPLEAKEAQTADSSGSAEAVHRDFTDLVAMFERQLASLPTADRQVRFHVAKAKAAAERGLVLSHKLIESLGR